MNRSIFFFLLTVSSIGVFSFKNSPPAVLVKDAPAELAPGKINWITWEEAQVKSAVQKKKIFVDVYTDWCGWCKKMDAVTFQQPHIAKYVNEHYYAIKFNAEQKEDIEFNGKKFKFVKNGKRGYHELAAEITRGRLSFPTVVFIDENFNVIQPVPGFQNADNFEQIITYFGRNEHFNTPWETYQNSYQPLPKE